MHMLRRMIPLIIWSMVICVGGCRPVEQTNNAIGSATETPAKTIVTTSYPIQWVTQKIIGDEYEVSFPAGSSDHPDRWRPDRETIPKIQAADLIVCNGIAAPYATWMQTVSLPSSKVVNSASKGLSITDFISVEDIQIVHTHGPEGKHSHPTMVSRTWLDPKMLVKQAKFITEKLCQHSPDNAAQLRDRLAKVTAELNSITPKPLPENTPAVFSATPELKFFTRAAGVADLHFNWNEKTTLKEAEADLMSKKETESLKFILFPQRLETLAKQLKPALQQRKLTPIFIDMLDHEDVDRDFAVRLQDNFDRLRATILD